MEFAQAAKALGLRAIHGAELASDGGATPVDRRRRRAARAPHAARARRARLAQPLPAAHARARAHARPDAAARVLGQPSVTLADVAEHAEGLVCLSGCARQGVRDEPTMRRLLRAFGRDAFRVELQRPVRPPRPRAEPRARRAGRAAGRAVRGDRRRPRPRARARAAAGRVRGHPRARDARRVRAAAARQPRARARHAGGDGRALRGPPGRGGRDARGWPSAALRPHAATSATATPAPRTTGADRDAWRRSAARASTTATRPGTGCAREAAARLEEELRAHRRARACRASSCCTATCSSSRARWRSRCAGRTPRARCCRRAAGAGSSVSSIVCYLTGLSHVDPVANELFLGRFLNEEITALPDIDLDFPRDVREVLIPRVHERYGRDHSALVAAFPTYRARGAIRELGKALGLPPGEIERVARGVGGLVRAPGRPRHRASRWARSGRRDRPLGAGSCGWPTRPTACRATSPSTRAG